MRARWVLYLAVACLAAAAALAGMAVAEGTGGGVPGLPPGESGGGAPGAGREGPRTFGSYEELVRYVRDGTALATALYGHSPFGPGPGPVLGDGTVRALRDAAPGAAAQAAEAPLRHSGTNVQVPGVDEADVVKTDGRFLYVLTGQKVAVVLAHPPEEARVVSELACEGRPLEAFLNGDRLVVFADGPQGETLIRVYDLGDRTAPVLKRELAVRGYYVTSRMIGDYVYAVLGAPLEAVPGDGKIALPEWRVDGRVQTVPPERIRYFGFPDRSYRYTMVLALNVRDDAAPPSENTFLTGVSQYLYASRQHVYLAGPEAPDPGPVVRGLLDRLAGLVPGETGAELARIRDGPDGPGEKLLRAGALLEDYLATLDAPAAAELAGRIEAARVEYFRELARQADRTVVYKFRVAGADVAYLGRGEVPGRVLDQFSMDEYGSHFRIATTTEGFLFPERPATRNNVFVLDENLQVVGRLTGLALSERIYAARFTGDRAYLVTFRVVDPLFVVDLRDPRQPRVLGELKIPGYSEYLHPYDENHLIGIGREAAEAPVPAGQGTVIFPPPVVDRGLKVALFDVSDPAAPREVASYVLENPRSDSEALRDHRAVLFDGDRGLLVIPVTLHPPVRILGGPGVAPRGEYWEGAYVFCVGPAEGVTLRGRISQDVPEAAAGGGAVRPEPVRRALYIGDTLYTVSECLVKACRLTDLREVGRVVLGAPPAAPRD